MKGYTSDNLDEALQGVEVVVIPAGVPRKVSLCKFLTRVFVTDSLVSGSPV